MRFIRALIILLDDVLYSVSTLFAFLGVGYIAIMLIQLSLEQQFFVGLFVFGGATSLLYLAYRLFLTLSYQTQEMRKWLMNNPHATARRIEEKIQIYVAGDDTRWHLLAVINAECMQHTPKQRNATLALLDPQIRSTYQDLLRTDYAQG